MSIDYLIETMPEKGPKVLVADIETAPMLVYAFGLFKQNISTNQIVEDSSLLSVAAKWLGHDYCWYRDTRGSPRDYKHLIWDVWYLLVETDMVIAHNGEAFDMRKLRTYMALHDLPPVPEVKVIDTLKLHRKAFAFDSHKLDYISNKFSTTPKSEHGMFPGFSLWKECLKDNSLAWDEMQMYNVLDIKSLEDVYMNLRGWYSGAPNMGAFKSSASGRMTCPNCGSENTAQRGYRRTQVGIYKRYRCNSCKGWFRGRTMAFSKEEREHIGVN